jgi:hypothetical protein
MPAFMSTRLATASSQSSSRSQSAAGELCLLLLLRHGDRLTAFGHDEGENLGGLGQAWIG